MTTHKDFEPIADTLSSAINGLAQLKHHPDVKDQATTLEQDAVDALSSVVTLIYDNPEHLPVRESAQVFEEAVQVIDRISVMTAAALPTLRKTADCQDLLKRCWEAEG